MLTVMETYDITTMKQLDNAVVAILAKQGKKDQATVFALSGDLGAGKTTFTQQLAKQLGVTEVVTSPTFVIMKNYQTTDERFGNLVHIDTYRFTDESEAIPLGIANLFNQPNILVCLEWPERVASLLPQDVTSLTFDLVGDKRTLTYEQKRK